MNNNVLVSISCITFNHAAYIRQCLDGFIMQKTNFVFEVNIHDDASTDGTADIIREYEKKYPEIIKPIFQIENQFSKYGLEHIYQIVNKKAQGKYIAMCDGDDYWTEPSKLQMQIDFLEEYPEYGLCYTKFSYFYNKTNQSIIFEGHPTNDFNSIVQENHICNSTSLFRRDMYLQYLETIQPESKHWKTSDLPVWLWIALKSKIHFLNHNTTSYRIYDTISRPKSIVKYAEFEISAIGIRAFFCNYANISYNKNDAEDFIYRHFINQALFQFDAKSIRILYKRLNSAAKSDRKYILLGCSRLLCWMYLKFYRRTAQ